eukprot:EC783880.1.p2 GENE.EC783880.1~~EC783880.1.p2  ORF type:complete len:55 (+),score=21.57 EC783880.1:79-243(+)
MGGGGGGGRVTNTHEVYNDPKTTVIGNHDDVNVNIERQQATPDEDVGADAAIGR